MNRPCSGSDVPKFILIAVDEICPGYSVEEMIGAEIRQIYSIDVMSWHLDANIHVCLEFQ